MTHIPRPVLRFRARDYEVGDAELVVGRDEDCAIAFEDPLVSRRHAVFRVGYDTLMVRDLGSKNGVKVNGRRITVETPLRMNDVVTIGSEQFEVRPPRITSGVVPRTLAETVTRDPMPSGGVSPVTSWAAAERALASGNRNEAEHLVGQGLSDTYVAIVSCRLGPAALEEPTRFALRLAVVTSNTKWLDWIFRAHQAAKAVLPVATVEELDRVGRALRYRVGSPMKSYVDSIASRLGELSASERFAFSRVQALVRTLLAA